MQHDPFMVHDSKFAWAASAATTFGAIVVGSVIGLVLSMAAFCGGRALGVW